MRNLCQILTALCIVIFAGSAFAQPSAIEIKDLSMPADGWGDNKISFKAFNHDEYIKFIVVKSVLEFEGASSPYENENRFTAFLEPGFWFEMDPIVTIPGNYGTATIKLEFYDVVDTMDMALPEQKFLDTAFSVEIKMPESARPWLQKAATFPPRVNEHPYFDNQFVRMMYAMIAEGKSRAEIAEITGASPDYVEANLKKMIGNRYLKKEGANVVPTFPVILTEEAEQVVKLVDKTVESLMSIVADNYSGYGKALDSLIEAGLLVGDSDNVLGPERVLYRPYVIISTLLLWHKMGTQFVTDGNPLAPYTNTDVCNANIVNFMYAAPSNIEFHGHHFYALIRDGGSGRLVFTGHIPKIHCEGNFPAQPGIPAKAIWRNDSEDQPEYFVYNPKTIEPMLEVLKKGTDDIIETALAELKKISVEQGREEVTTGYRYWFWNLVASKTLDSLIEQRVVEPYGNDNYILGISGGR